MENRKKLIIFVALIFFLVVGGVYYFSRQGVLDLTALKGINLINTTSETASVEDEAVPTTAESDDLDDIENDLSDLDISNLDAELTDIDNELSSSQ